MLFDSNFSNKLNENCFVPLVEHVYAFVYSGFNNNMHTEHATYIKTDRKMIRTCSFNMKYYDTCFLEVGVGYKTFILFWMSLV